MSRPRGQPAAAPRFSIASVSTPVRTPAAEVSPRATVEPRHRSSVQGRGTGLPRFVLCRHKRAIAERWQRTDPPPTARQAEDWVNSSRGLTGIVPGSVGLFDVYEGGGGEGRRQAVGGATRLRPDQASGRPTSRRPPRERYPTPHGAKEKSDNNREFTFDSRTSISALVFNGPARVEQYPKDPAPSPSDSASARVPDQRTRPSPRPTSTRTPSPQYKNPRRRGRRGFPAPGAVCSGRE